MRISEGLWTRPLVLRRSRRHQLLEGLPLRRHVVFGGEEQECLRTSLSKERWFAAARRLRRCTTRSSSCLTLAVAMGFLPKFNAIKLVALHSGKHKDPTVGRGARLYFFTRRFTGSRGLTAHIDSGLEREFFRCWRSPDGGDPAPALRN